MIPTKIIIHHSLTKDSKTVSWGAIRRYHTIERGWRDIGYHFGIEQVYDAYEVFLGRLPNVQGAHTLGQNHNSIGICVVGNYDEDTLPIEAYIKLVDLCKYLVQDYGIDPTEVYGHCDFASKSCPGNKFPLNDLKRDVARSK